jgi:hypothetical protein
MNKPEKLAAAFLRHGKIFLHPYSKTTGGFWIFSLPVFVIDEGDDGVGARVLRVLSESRESLPHPKLWKGLTDPLTRAAGVRSFNAFAKGAKCVNVSARG